MQQIADWLEKLGLEQYAQRFAENDVDFDLLADLTDQDLKELGVASLGHRRRLLRAIAELNVAQKGTAQPLSATGIPITPHDTAERRQVTVMFSDLVGSTALSARMDPEDLREVISAYQKCVAETVRRFGGYVAKYMGDGVLVYFGYPRAHEDDAERALRAGLELVAAVSSLKTHVPLQTRVGVATGLAAQFQALAERQGATIPLMIGHRLMGMSLLNTGDIAAGRAHLDRAIALYCPAEHRPLAVRFGQDVRVAVSSFRSLALWLLGYPDAALADVDQALKDAREISQAPTLMYALVITSLTLIHCGNAAAATMQLDEVAALAAEKGALLWKAIGTTNQGCVLALTGTASDAIQMITSGITAFRSTGSTLFTPWYLSNLAKAYAELGQFDEACRCVGEAMTAVERSKERWCEAEVHRVAGEIALMAPEPDVAKAGSHFERALAVARSQQAKSWELRAAMSMARLWRDRGKRNEARKILSPVYGWFTEGFDTLDLKQAKALLEELAL